jgi:hypothetical protein
MKAVEIFRQKVVLKHETRKTLVIFEMAIFQIPKSEHYPEGIKYRAWLSEGGETVFGFDNHKPKGPHLHIGDQEVGYVFRGIKELKNDVMAMIRKAGYIYEE